ncbi:hypothetical protein H4R20_002685, partial [Coemansia guatemalensis]
MGSKSDSTSLARDGGTLNLAHSLMRSRLTWITNAFDHLDERCMVLSREFLGLAELQIGPHIFPKVKFYRIVEPSSANTGIASSKQPLRRLLAFEFADNPGALFWVPPDLGIDYKRCGKPDTLHVYFFASPRRRAVDRRPSRIRQEWPHYYSADKALTRVNIDMLEANQRIIDAVSDYVEEHTVRVCRDYRLTLAQSAPTVKYWYSFFSRQHRGQLLEAAKIATSDVKSPSVRVSRAADKILAAEEEEKPQASNENRIPLLPVIKSHSFGGKGGYNAAVAAAYFKSRRGSGLKADEDSEEDDDDDTSDGNEDNEEYGGLAASTDKITSKATA